MARTAARGVMGKSRRVGVGAAKSAKGQRVPRAHKALLLFLFPFSLLFCLLLCKEIQGQLEH